MKNLTGTENSTKDRRGFNMLAQAWSWLIEPSPLIIEPERRLQARLLIGHVACSFVARPSVIDFILAWPLLQTGRNRRDDFQIPMGYVWRCSLAKLRVWTEPKCALLAGSSANRQHRFDINICSHNHQPDSYSIPVFFDPRRIGRQSVSFGARDGDRFPHYTHRLFLAAGILAWLFHFL